jgi:hypothetical protein
MAFPYPKYKVADTEAGQTSSANTLVANANALQSPEVICTSVSANSLSE